MSPNSLPTRLRSVVRPARRARLSRVRVRLGDGVATTLHVASYPRETYVPHVVRLERVEQLVQWCGSHGLRHAVIGGFFIRPEYAPLGALQIDGRLLPSVPFDSPWDEVRACVQIDQGEVRIGRRHELPDGAGDLLQAGPLLVRQGRRVVEDGSDDEGFSAGAHQFDSDITAGRYPRAALAVAEERLLAVACDGRTQGDAGMTLPELADALVELGADEALNLDGGGSASLIHQGKLRNRPREEHGVDLLGGRQVVSAIVFAAR